MDWRHPTGRTPKHVAVVALGPSRANYISQTTSHTPPVNPDEVWTVNTAVRWLQHDVCFLMDDMHEFAKHFPEYGAAMRKAQSPILTSVAYPEFSKAVAYPLAEVLNNGTGRMYFNNSGPYIIAYALLIGVEKLSLFGLDYSFPGSDARENGRGSVEYWIGVAEARGMQVDIAKDSTLCDTNRGLCFYGYIRQPVITERPSDTPGKIVRPNLDRLSDYRGVTELENVVR